MKKGISLLLVLTMLLALVPAMGIAAWADDEEPVIAEENEVPEEEAPAEEEIPAEEEVPVEEEIPAEEVPEEELPVPEEEVSEESPVEEIEAEVPVEELEVPDEESEESAFLEGCTDVKGYGDYSLKKGGHAVYYPASLETKSRKWPVIVWANGTACIPATYIDLFKGLAQNGFVVVSSSDVMSANGKDQCDSIDYIFELNENPDSVFYHKIDTGRVAAVGHSQGGRSSVNAAQRDSRIRCVVSIAGSNTKGEPDGLKTPTFFLTGTADAIVLSSLWVKPAYNKVEGPAVYASLVGGFHTTSMIAPKYIQGYIVKWLNAVLYGDASALACFRDGGELSKDKNWTDVQSKNLDSLSAGSVLSQGSVWIVAALAVLAVGSVTALVIVKKKKRVGA